MLSPLGKNYLFMSIHSAHNVIGTDTYTPHAVFNPAIPEDILSQINQMKQGGIDNSDIIQKIRLKMVPTEFTPQTMVTR